MAPITIDYAAAYGYNSLAAAIVFTIAYIPPSVWFVFKAFKNFTRVWIILVLFTQIRIVAFLIRALEIGVDSVAENKGILIADQVLLLAGFFGLLFATYGVLIDRELFLEDTYQLPALFKRLRRPVFHMIGMAAIILGIIAATQAQSPDSSFSPGTLRTFRKASSALFLLLTVVVTLQAMLLIHGERNVTIYESVNHNGRDVATHGAKILGAIAALMLLREIYIVAVVDDPTKQTNEHLWYPLVALPELLCVFLYCAPGVVPSRKDLPVQK